MLESVEKLMAAGLGMLSMTREKAEEIFDDLVRRGEAAKTGRDGFVRSVVDAAAGAFNKLASLNAPMPITSAMLQEITKAGRLGRRRF